VLVISRNEVSKYSVSCKTILETMIVNVVISETDACMNVVLSKAEKHVPYGELVGTAECVTLKLRCRTIRTHYN